jgi:hypothetical protein
MTPERFFSLGAYMGTHTYSARGGPQPPENGEHRARWENFEIGPYAARFGIYGEIRDAVLSAHDLIFEVDFGSHVVSALRIIERDINGQRKYTRVEWANAPSDADLVALTLLIG